MSKHKEELIQLIQQPNLIGKEDHQHFLKVQASYGFAQRGGSLSFAFRPQSKRLAHTINLLNWQERKVLIHSEFISKN